MCWRKIFSLTIIGTFRQGKIHIYWNKFSFVSEEAAYSVCCDTNILQSGFSSFEFFFVAKLYEVNPQWLYLPLRILNLLFYNESQYVEFFFRSRLSL